MGKVIGICDLYDMPALGKLTITRPFGTVSFLGRYDLMDFALSNFANSGIENIYIPVARGIDIVRTHISNGAIWVNNTKIGSVVPHLFETGLLNPALNTDVNNISELLEDSEVPYDYVVVTSPKFLYCFDFNKAVELLKKRGADVAMLYSKIYTNQEDFEGCNMLRVGEKDAVSSIRPFTPKKSGVDLDLETYVFTRQAFNDMLKKAQQLSYKSTIRTTLDYMIEHKTLKAVGCMMEKYVAPITSMKNYVKYSLDLLDVEKRNKFFSRNWTIYTPSHNTPPALYGETSEVNNATIANGSIIHGKVTNSILARDCVVSEGAVVKNCILSRKTYIGPGVVLENVVTDKFVSITEHKLIKGKKNEVFEVGYQEKM